jgi:hypothetical protein
MARVKKSGRKKGKRRPRSLPSYQRREEGRRQPRERILIVCEGDETEPRYFESLRKELKLGTVAVVVKRSESRSAPINVVDYALLESGRKQKKSRRKSPQDQPSFDEIWCVFDVDQHESFHRVVNKARDNGLELAVSNPAFEYWYLLHFVQTDRPFADASDVIRALKEYISNYDKRFDVFVYLFDYTDEAIDRARRLLANRPDPDDDFPNPSTLAFKLVKKLKSMSNW